MAPSSRSPSPAHPLLLRSSLTPTLVETHPKATSDLCSLPPPSPLFLLSVSISNSHPVTIAFSRGPSHRLLETPGSIHSPPVLSHLISSSPRSPWPLLLPLSWAAFSTNLKAHLPLPLPAPNPFPWPSSSSFTHPISLLPPRNPANITSFIHPNPRKEKMAAASLTYSNADRLIAMNAHSLPHLLIPWSTQ